MDLFQKLQFLKETVDQPMKPFIHPDNLFVSGESVLLGHRGMTDSVVPFSLMKIINPKTPIDVIVLISQWELSIWLDY